MFGRPEKLTNKVRSLYPVKESNPATLIYIATKVGDMATFLESVGGSYHLSNPLLLSELLAMLPVGRRLQWAERCLAQNDIPTINDFSQWLSDIRKIVNMATDALSVASQHKRDTKYAFTSVERTKCSLCQDKCKSMMNCKVFLRLPLETRWQIE